jgi:hypothetical protein
MAGALSGGKIAEVLFEETLDVYNSQQTMLPLVDFIEPDPAALQNAGNVIWRPVQQHAPIISGFDLTGLSTGIIEETYPSYLGTPANDLVNQRADDLRDEHFWRNRGRQSGMRQASNLNQAIANSILNTGSICYRDNTTSGYTFIATAEAILKERQLKKDQSYFMLNDRHNLKFANDLAGRQTLQGRPEQVWDMSQIGQNVANFDLYTGSFIGSLAGGADPATTVTANQSFKPEGGSVNTTTLVVTNVDYRTATIPVTASAGYNVGDRVTFANGGVTVKALGLDDKTNTGQAMTFVIVAKPNATSVTVWPKPIAADDPALTSLEAAYANIDTRILNTATMNRVNIDASAKPSLFWTKDSIEVIGGDCPIHLFKEFAGKKVISETMKNGLKMYMIYDGDSTKLELQFRIFTWFGVTNKAPAKNGVAISF